MLDFCDVDTLDSHFSNWGFKKDGTVVWIDFGNDCEYDPLDEYDYDED